MPRRTKTGAIHAHSKSIQQQEREWKEAGFSVDPRARLLAETRHYLNMLETWDDGSAAVTVAWKACKNLLDRLEEKSC